MSSAATLHHPHDSASRVAERRWPAPFHTVLSKLVAGGQQYFGSDAIAVEPVRQFERPFSNLLQIRVADGSGSQGAFIKILKPRGDTQDQIASMRENVTRDFDMTVRVRDALAATPGLTAVRPIACFPEDLALVTGEAVGPTLSQGLASKAAGWSGGAAVQEISNAIRLVGAWLKEAQAALPRGPDVSLDTMRRYLDTRLDILETNGPIRLTTSGRLAIERYRNHLIGGITAQDLRSAWIHGDFCPDNIIIRTGQVTVLDFLMAKTGTVYHDVAHLYMHVDSMKVKPWFRPAVIERLQRDLLDGIQPGLDARPAALCAHVAPAPHLPNGDAADPRAGEGGPLLRRARPSSRTGNGWRGSPGSAKKAGPGEYPRRLVQLQLPERG